MREGGGEEAVDEDCANDDEKDHRDEVFGLACNGRREFSLRGRVTEFDGEDRSDGGGYDSARSEGREEGALAIVYRL